jgi:hypothetical protein
MFKVCKGQPFLNWMYSNTRSIKDDPYRTSCREKRLKVCFGMVYDIWRG